MRLFLLSNLVIFAAACRGAPQKAREPSWNAQDARRAAERGVPLKGTPETGATAPPVLACGDTVLNDQITSGGEQLTEFVPCTTIDTSSAPPAGDAPSSEKSPTNPAKKGPAIQAPER